MSEITKWKQERPTWCPHTDCVFKRRAMDAICGGQLPQSEPHDGDFNTHRFCINGALPNNEVFDLQTNRSDIYWFRFIFDALFPLAELKAAQERAAAQESRWQPIESAPKDGTTVLVWDQRMFIATWQTAALYWCEVGIGTSLYPTHWQPLPAPPEPREVKS